MKPSFYSLMIAVLTGCTAQYVPLDFDPSLNNTVAYIEVDSVNYSLEFLSAYNNHITFWLQVENNSPNPVSFVEDNVVSYTHIDSISSDMAMQGNWAQSPGDIRRFYREKEKTAQGLAAFALILGAAVVVADVAGDIKDSNKETWTWEDEKKYQNRNALTEASLVTANIVVDAALESGDKARVESHYLPDELFLWNEMDPGAIREGKVVFKRGALGKFYRIHMNSNDKKLNFDFRKATESEKQALLGY
ncbi:MAG: hypothetical protein CMB80_06805 [Flammeovirgaceae bacterium]|nr:hypothetical protein [Flammeovirgaceae bacterium]HCX23394.1 hypothetical protein [Cytophagales bacterium]